MKFKEVIKMENGFSEHIGSKEKDIQFVGIDPLSGLFD